MPSSAQTTSETPLPSSATGHPVGDMGQAHQSTQNLVTPHLWVQKKIRTWCRETPGNPSSATAPAGGRHEEGSCTPSPRELQCQHHTPCPGSLTHTKTPQTWCCLYSSHSVTRRGRKVRDRGSRPNLQEMGPSSHPEGKRFGVQRLLVTSSQGLGKQPVLFGRTKSP